jgi:hypothetical protein
MRESLIPFVLRRRRLLPRELPSGSDLRYDESLQLWINATSGRPAVTDYANTGRDRSTAGSQFGETTNTRTQEGVDQSEVICASDFGETAITKTQEGIDTTERLAPLARHPEPTLAVQRGSVAVRVGESKFGETIFTATREGVDQSEGSS